MSKRPVYTRDSQYGRQMLANMAARIYAGYASNGIYDGHSTEMFLGAAARAAEYFADHFGVFDFVTVPNPELNHEVMDTAKKALLYNELSPNGTMREVAQDYKVVQDYKSGQFMMHSKSTEEDNDHP